MGNLTNQQFAIIYRKSQHSISRSKLKINKDSDALKAERKTIELAMRNRCRSAVRANLYKFIKSLKKDDMVKALIASYDSIDFWTDNKPFEYCRLTSKYRPPCDVSGLLDIRKMAGFKEAVEFRHFGTYEVDDAPYTDKERAKIKKIDAQLDKNNKKLDKLNTMLDDFMDEVVLDGNANLMQKLINFDNICQLVD